jgi:transposase
MRKTANMDGLKRSLGQRKRIRPEAHELDDMLNRMDREQVAKVLGVTRATVTGWVWKLKLRHHRMNPGKPAEKHFSAEHDAVCLAHARQPMGSVTPGKLSYWQSQGLWMTGESV